MADGQTETVIVGGGQEVTGRHVEGHWRVSISDHGQAKPASKAVAEVFGELMIAQTAANRAGNDWGVRLGELIHYAEAAGFKLNDIAPEAIDAPMLDAMARNPGLKPYVENVHKAMAMKDQFEAMETKCFNRLEAAVERQLSGREVSLAAPDDAQVAQLNIPDLRHTGMQRG